MDRLAELDIFARVVDAGSFSAAARELGCSPSAVSKRIAALESRLQARLLQRTTRKLALTAIGEEYYRRACAILADVEQAEAALSAMQGAARGRLRVTAPTAFGQFQLVPLVKDFMARHPEVELELDLSDAMADLIRDGYDMAVRIARLEDSSFVARQIATDRRVVCASPAYLDRHGIPATPAELASHQCLTYSRRGDLAAWFDGDAGPALSGRFSSGNSIALRDAALAGLGITRLATFLIGPDLRSGRLVPLLQGYERPGIPIRVVYPHRRYLSPKVRAFMDYLVARFSPRPPWD